jgi:hypothetical protein
MRLRERVFFYARVTVVWPNNWKHGLPAISADTGKFISFGRDALYWRRDGMSIFRVVKSKDNPYLMMNKHGIDNPELSWKAKGILVYLLALPDDWQIYEKELAKHSADGKDCLSSGIQELIKAGYITRTRRRNKKGQLADYEYRVFEVPTYTGFSKVGKTKIGESAPTNKDVTNIDLNNSKDKGILPEDKNSPFLFTFKEAVNWNWNPEQIEAVEYYMKIYKMSRKTEHPKLTVDQWEEVREGILSNCFDEHDRDYEIGINSEIDMISQHFKTKYRTGCNYNVLHYISGNIRAMRMFEVAY